MVWTVIYSIAIVSISFLLILLLNDRLIPKETKVRLNKSDLPIYRKNLILALFCFIVANIILLIQHLNNISNLLIYLPTILIAYFGVRKLVANINLLNKNN